MRIDIKGLAELRERLESVRPAEIMERMLAAAAEDLANAVRDKLSDPPGAGSHDAPWARTGALHDSIQATATGLEAAIGSNDPAAAPQEMGTNRIPPRPFLAPTAAESAPAIASKIGQAVADALRGENTSQTGITSPAPTTGAAPGQQ